MSYVFLSEKYTLTKYTREGDKNTNKQRYTLKYMKTEKVESEDSLFL